MNIEVTFVLTNIYDNWPRIRLTPKRASVEGFRPAQHDAGQEPNGDQDDMIEDSNRVRDKWIVEPAQIK